MERQSWNTKLGFLLAAIGSAVGLGNIWRFPYTAATNGGGAFLVPYFFAIITAGIPILILEYTIGKTYRGGAPVALARINKKFEWLGWFQVMVAFIIAVYYLAIIVWVVSYIGYSFGLAWGTDPTSFFLEYLGVTSSALELGGVQLNLVGPFIIVWAITAFILYRGISGGIEIACKICLPILLVFTIVLVIRGITLPGAIDGLNYLFTPNWEAITDSSVWTAAYGQVFFSLSIAFAIMISYSSYLPKKTDVVNSAFITATANHGFELLAGIAVFSVLGYMAYAQGVPVDEVSAGGVGLAFMVFPAAINTLPAFKSLIGICFFGALFTAGITSLISILQAVITGISDKFDVPHKKSTTIVLVPAFVISILFITGAGLNILDIVDAFINNVGVAGAGLIEVILIGWFFNLEKIREEANQFSNFSVGKWWIYSLKIVTVVVLGVMVISNTITFIREGYGGYSSTDVTIFGWGSLIVALVIMAILKNMKGKEGYSDLSNIKEVE
ncbi:MAG: sodium-dependent transporter [Clostridiales bacterium]|nr:sodium-dependent transporter [Clostridiales bacterium]